MANSPELSFQKAINDAVLAALPTTPSGSHPPGEQKLPYVQFGQGDASAEPESSWTITTEVHTWSSKEGPHEVKTMMQAIREQLHRSTFSKDEWQFTCCVEEFSTVLLDEDGMTWHGVQRFKVFASS